MFFIWMSVSLAGTASGKEIELTDGNTPDGEIAASFREALSSGPAAIQSAVQKLRPSLMNDPDILKKVFSLLFSPEQLLRPIIEQAVAHTEVNIWVVDTEGTMLYDIMADHIGLNLFTAPLYQPFPSLLAIGRRIVAEPEGRGRYSFYRPQTNEQVTKEATWKTVSLYGKEWRTVAYRMVKE